MKEIEITGIDSNFQREELKHFFGFKGGYLTELWQNIVHITSKNGFDSIGMATQSVLYGDSNLFASTSESNGNALMFVTTNRALKAINGSKFETPIALLDQIIPQLYHEAKEITGINQLNINFLYNALSSIDNALWLLYAAENSLSTFYDMIPFPYKSALSHQNKKIAIMFQIPYNMPISDIVKAAEEGYFVFKIKTGFPGSPEEMLRKDINRLTEIHQALNTKNTSQTPTGKLYYTMDANGRYPDKEMLFKYLDHARAIGAFEHILLYEEPFVEHNTENVSDMGILIAADESIHTEKDAYAKLNLGYGAFVLKGIAKTLSSTMKIANIAYQHQIPCICSDLTVNPILVEWNKNVAAAVAPFPGLEMGIIETNGDMNYKNWTAMKSRHPYPQAKWANAINGAFELDGHYFENGGGIFDVPSYYRNFFKQK
ncbi:mandelate racemase/muconate lactonizing enzyme family protein [Sphingobacterium tabacisoli]|uniref:Enolase C-terminal domain-like protein n=1 Tax=Sphingobacterium tabacisoli TaxID=2044855 RepID=A0ABW5L8T7_9SPHI|nr:mandelate racemase/muconate lactonizing enzyme family protein [Sphingobacterium tabacisoli]